MNELRAAAEAMAQTVKNMMHSRIAYAKKDKIECEQAYPTGSARCGFRSGFFSRGLIAR